MPNYLHLTTYFLSFALGVVAFAACVNSLVQRNHDFQRAEAVAAHLGVTLEISSSNLDEPSYALAAGTCLVMVFSLAMLLNAASHVKMLLRGVFVVLPIALLIGTLVVLGSGIAVIMRAKLGHLNILATLHGFPVPQSIIEDQAASLGLSLRYWDRNYVRFMAIAPWPLFPFALAGSFFAFSEWREEEEQYGVAPLERAEQSSGTDLEAAKGYQEQATSDIGE